MPSLKNHSRFSIHRTGRSFVELHRWMNEEYTNPNPPKRHDITKIPENLEIVREKFGDQAVEEFLYHIKEDYEENKVYKMVKLLAAIKEAVFSPFKTLKNQ